MMPCAASSASMFLLWRSALRLVQPAAAVELVAAALHNGIEADAAVGHLRAIADGAHRRLFDRRVVPVVRLPARRLQAAGLHAFERVVRLGALAEHVRTSAPGSDCFHRRRASLRTPGACARRLTMLLRLVGSASSVSRVNCVVAAVDLTSTTGDAPDTVMVSASEPTCSGTSTLAVKPTVSRTPSRRTVWKPDSRILDDVGADRKGRHAVLAAFIGHADKRRNLKRRARRGHGDTGQHGSARVSHLARDARILLGARRSCEQREQQ